MGTTARQHLIYRDGNGADLLAHLRTAIGDFFQRQRQLPAEAVVHPTRLDAAKAALTALDLPQLPVTACGGCLASEVWLGVPAKETSDEQCPTLA